MTNGALDVYVSEDAVCAKIPFSICAQLFRTTQDCKKVIWAPEASRKILRLPNPLDRNDQECAVVIELIRSVSWLRDQSNDLQRMLAKQLMYAKVSSGDR